MDAAIVVDDPQGTGRGLSEWLISCGCSSTVVADFQQAEATVVYQQLAGAERLLVFGPLAPTSAAYFRALQLSNPEVLRGFYTQSPARDHDAALISQHGLIGILHQPFSQESPAAIGMSSAGRGAYAVVELPPEPPPQPLTSVSASSAVPAKGQATFVPFADERADAPPDPRRALWVAMIEEQPGCCRALCEELAMPSVMVKMMPSWQEAADLALHALTGGLVIGPLTSDAVRLCRRLQDASNGSQVILYTESQSQSQDPRLAHQYGCLAIVRKPFTVDVVARLVERIRAPDWRPPERAAPTAPTGPSTARVDRAAEPVGTVRMVAPSSATSVATARIVPAKSADKTPPVSGIAAIRARREAAKSDAPADPADSATATTRRRRVACVRCGVETMVPVGRTEGVCQQCAGV